MAHESEKALQARAEQIIYAGILEKGMLIGLAILLVTYAIYVFGIVDPYLPLAEVPNYWGLSSDKYLEQADIHAGWAWVSMLKYADFLNFIGIAMLSGVTIVCFLAIIPTLWKSNDRTYAVFALVEALILIVAASGILGTGGH